jgi:hypothetical protein
MSITFLSPEAAVIGLAVVVPLAALFLAESRAHAARAVLHLPGRLTRGSAYTIAIAAFAVLISLGAAQPVLERDHTRPVRHDAEVLFVIDTSKSMASASGPDAEPRFERARKMAKRMRAALPEIPAGVASLADRVLLHLFPTNDATSFRRTLDESLGIERPPSVQRRNLVVTHLDALAEVAKGRFFRDSSKRRLLVIFTDAETRPFDTGVLANAFRGSRISTILVRVGDSSERLFDKGVVDPRYQAPPGAAESAQLFAEAVGGATFDEADFDQAIKAARTDAGPAGEMSEVTDVTPTPLASYAFAFAFVPLGFLLWRRNLR